MAKQLRGTVYLYGDDGELHAFGPDDDVPGWAAARLSDDAYESIDSSEGDDGAKQPAKKAAPRKSS